MVSRSGIAVRTGILLIVTRKKQRLNELVPLLLFTVRATKHGLIVIALLFYWVVRKGMIAKMVHGFTGSVLGFRP
jgi:hypothetical protein